MVRLANQTRPRLPMKSASRGNAELGRKIFGIHSTCRTPTFCPFPPFRNPQSEIPNPKSALRQAQGLRFASAIVTGAAWGHPPPLGSYGGRAAAYSLHPAPSFASSGAIDKAHDKARDKGSEWTSSFFLPALRVPISAFEMRGVTRPTAVPPPFDLPPPSLSGPSALRVRQPPADLGLAYASIG